MTVLSDLATASNRAVSVNRRGASEKQVTFLASLMEQLGHDADVIGCGCAHTNAILTSKVASGWIGQFLADAKALPPKPAAVSAVNCKAVVDALTAAKGKLKWPKIRFSDVDVKLSIAGDRAKVPGSVNVTSSTGGFGEAVWFGRITPEGVFQPSRQSTQQVEDFLATLAADFHGTVKAHGQNTGNCCFCHQPLTDEVSVKAGFGPVCAKNFGLTR